MRMYNLCKKYRVPASDNRSAVAMWRGGSSLKDDVLMKSYAVCSTAFVSPSLKWESVPRTNNYEWVSSSSRNVNKYKQMLCDTVSESHLNRHKIKKLWVFPYLICDGSAEMYSQLKVSVSLQWVFCFRLS